MAAGGIHGVVMVPEGGWNLVVRILVGLAAPRGNEIIRMTIGSRRGVTAVQVYRHGFGKIILLANSGPASAACSDRGTGIKTVISPDGCQGSGNQFDLGLLHGQLVGILRFVR